MKLNHIFLEIIFACAFLYMPLVNGMVPTKDSKQYSSMNKTLKMTNNTNKDAYIVFVSTIESDDEDELVGVYHTDKRYVISFDGQLFKKIPKKDEVIVQNFPYAIEYFVVATESEFEAQKVARALAQRSSLKIGKMKLEDLMLHVQLAPQMLQHFIIDIDSDGILRLILDEQYGMWSKQDKGQPIKNDDQKNNNQKAFIKNKESMHDSTKNQFWVVNTSDSTQYGLVAYQHSLSGKIEQSSSIIALAPEQDRYMIRPPMRFGYFRHMYTSNNKKDLQLLENKKDLKITVKKYNIATSGDIYVLGNKTLPRRLYLARAAKGGDIKNTYITLEVSGDLLKGLWGILGYENIQEKGAVALYVSGAGGYIRASPVALLGAEAVDGGSIKAQLPLLKTGKVLGKSTLQGKPFIFVVYSEKSNNLKSFLSIGAFESLSHGGVEDVFPQEYALYGKVVRHGQSIVRPSIVQGRIKEAAGIK